MMTLRKIPENAEVKTYKPDAKQVDTDTARDKSKQKTNVKANQSSKTDKDVSYFTIIVSVCLFVFTQLINTWYGMGDAQ